MQEPRRWRAGFCRIASFISMSKCPSSERFRLMSIQSLKSQYLWISWRFLRLEIVGTIARQSNVNNYRDCSRRCSNAFSLVPLLRSSCPPPPETSYSSSSFFHENRGGISCPPIARIQPRGASCVWRKLRTGER